MLQAQLPRRRLNRIPCYNISISFPITQVIFAWARHEVASSHSWFLIFHSSLWLSHLPSTRQGHTVHPLLRGSLCILQVLARALVSLKTQTQNTVPITIMMSGAHITTRLTMCLSFLDDQHGFNHSRTSCPTATSSNGRTRFLRSLTSSTLIQHNHLLPPAFLCQ